MAIGQPAGIVFLFILSTVSVECTVKTFDCLLKDFDKTYTGTYHTTRNGVLCQRWDDQYPHTHSRKSGFPDANITAASNYCRNPDPGTQRWQWCYTIDPAKTWEFCNIPYCTTGSECRLTAQATEYRGTTINVTETGEECMLWGDRWWLNYQAGGFNFNEETIEDVHNYCRNFGAPQSRIWCHKLKDGWGYCQQPPLCDLTYTCAHIPDVENAVFAPPTEHNGPYPFNTQVEYECNTGYEFTTQFSGIMCLMNGSWTDLPVCSLVKCPTLDVPQSAVTQTGPVDSYRSIATYACYDGFILTSGDTVLRCQSNKTWNGTKPACTQINCGDPPILAVAALQTTTTTLLGGVAFYKCPDDNTPYHKQCTVDGQWQGEIKCEPVTEATPFYQTPEFIGGVTAVSLVVFIVILALSIAVYELKHQRIRHSKPPKHSSRIIKVLPSQNHPTYYDHGPQRWM